MNLIGCLVDLLTDVWIHVWSQNETQSSSIEALKTQVQTYISSSI